MSSALEPQTNTSPRRPLTPWELPNLLTPVQFALTSQIHRRFHDIIRSDRTTRRHLTEMEALGYLDVVPTRGVSPLFPKVYYVTGRGARKLQEALAAKGKPWLAGRVDRRGQRTQEGYAAEHVIHEILITEFLLNVWETVNARTDLELFTVQRRSLPKHPAFRIVLGGRRTRLIPDAMFLIRQVGQGMMSYFVEMDTGTMNQKQLQAKFRRYEAWSRSETGRQYLVDLYSRNGATDPRPNFRVLGIVRDRSNAGDSRRLAETIKAAEGVSASSRKRLWFTTVEQLSSRQQDSPISDESWSRRLEVNSGKRTIDRLVSLWPEQNHRPV